MSVYTVREARGNQKPAEHLAARGLNAKVATLASLGPLAVPEYPQIAYKLYTKLLPAFMLATKENTVLPTTKPGYLLQIPVSHCITMPIPNLAVQFLNPLSSAEVEELKKMGAAEVPIKAGDRLYTFTGEVITKDLIEKLLRHSKKAHQSNYTPQGAVNLAGFFQHIKAVGIASAFLATQSYPAFSGPRENDSSGGAYDFIEGLVSGKRKVIDEHNGGKRQKQAEGGDQNGDEDEEMDDEAEEPTVEEYRFGDEITKVPKAKPSTPPVTLSGMASQLPTLPGLLFPYFDNMIESDGNYVAEVIRDYFLECLSDSREGIRAQWPRLKGGLGSYAFSKSGMALQHLYLGIRLAIEAQARLFPLIQDRRYLGFTLHGWYFTVNIDDRQFSPVAYDELLKLTTKVDEHAVSVAMILGRLSKLTISGKKPTKTQMAQFKEQSTSPGGLAAVIRKFNVDDESEIEEIEKLATKLSFPQRFRPITTETILGAVDLLLSGTFPPVEAPMYTRNGVMTSRSPELAIFAQFGDQAFSFLNTGGRGMKVPKDRSLDTYYKPVVIQGKTKNPKPNLIVAKKSLRLCVEDWKSFMVSRTFLNRETRDQAFRSVQFTADRAKDLWYGLIDRIGPLAVADKDIRADQVDIDGNEENAASEDEDYMQYLV